jgi:hypothetical protein
MLPSMGMLQTARQLHTVKQPATEVQAGSCGQTHGPINAIHSKQMTRAAISRRHKPNIQPAQLRCTDQTGRWVQQRQRARCNECCPQHKATTVSPGSMVPRLGHHLGQSLGDRPLSNMKHVSGAAGSNDCGRGTHISHASDKACCDA